jgi:Arm DNA-binding domain
VFIVLYRIGGADSKLRKYTIGPYGRVTLHQARVATQRVFAAKLEGRDPAAEKRAAKRRVVADRVGDLLEMFIAQRLSQNRSGSKIARLLRREVGLAWVGRSIHVISKRDVVELVATVEQRGAPAAANKTLKSIKTFLRWCVGRAVLDQSPAENVPLPSKEIARWRRVLLSMLRRRSTDRRRARSRVGSFGLCLKERTPYAMTLGKCSHGKTLPMKKQTSVLTTVRSGSSRRASRLLVAAASGQVSRVALAGLDGPLAELIPPCTKSRRLDEPRTRSLSE